MELFLVGNGGKVGAGPEIVLLSGNAALVEDIRPPHRSVRDVSFLTRDTKHYVWNEQWFDETLIHIKRWYRQACERSCYLEHVSWRLSRPINVRRIFQQFSLST